jgi:parvulin-like peptidyl-prolyl isomerase
MMDQAFEDAAFKAPLNSVTGPVKTAFGYHLIMVTEVKEEGA